MSRRVYIRCLFRIILFSIIQFPFDSFLKAQTDKEFWFVIPYTTCKHQAFTALKIVGGQPGRFYITSLGETDVTISMPNASRNQTLWTKHFSRDTTYVYTVPYRFLKKDSTGRPRIEDSAQYQPNTNGIQITSSGSLITAYYAIDNPNNKDLFSLKGKNALGLEFYIPMQKLLNCHTFAAPNQALSGFHIVATEDNTQIQITPSITLPGGRTAGVPFNITLDKGQTYFVASANGTAANHMPGTRVKVMNSVNGSKKIAITVQDDSVDMPPGAPSSWDYQGDQITPVYRFQDADGNPSTHTNADTISVVGKEYIVMKGRLTYPSGDRVVFVPANRNNNNKDTIRIYTSTKPYVNAASVPFKKLILTSPAYSYKVSYDDTFPNSGAITHYYIRCSEPTYVYHVSGNGLESGAGLIPKIDGCTGSNSVSVFRSSTDQFFLNIMTKDPTNLHIVYKDSATNTLKDVPLLASFSLAGAISAPNPRWYTLTANNFTNIIKNNTLIKVYSTSKFHIGVISGNTSGGCQYGYFSDFSEENPYSSVFEGTNLTNGAQVCYGTKVYLTASNGISYNWYGTDTVSKNYYLNSTSISNPVFSGPPGLFSYAVDITDACTYTVKTYPAVKIYVVNQVIANFDVDKLTSCSPLTTFSFTNRSFGADTFYWALGDHHVPNYTDTSSNLLNPVMVHKYAFNNSISPKTYSVYLRAVNYDYNCISEVTKAVTIYPKITASYLRDSAKSGCNPWPIHYTNKSTGDTSKAVYYWDFGDLDRTYLRNPSHLFLNPDPTSTGNDKSYYVKMLATSEYGCKDSIPDTITVHAFLDGSFTLDTASGCSDFTVRAHNSSRGKINTYNWNFGLGEGTATLANPPPYTYVNPTASQESRTLKLTVTNAKGCVNKDSALITIYPKVQANFNIPPAKLQICDSTSVSLTGSSGSLASVNYRWDLGDGTSSSLQTLSHIFHNADFTKDRIDTVRLTVSLPGNQCSDTAIRTIKIFSPVKADYILDKVTGCGKTTINVKNVSYGGIDSLFWSFGKGVKYKYKPGAHDAISQIYNAPVLLPEYDTVRLIANSRSTSAPNRCRDTVTRIVTIYPGINDTIQTTVTYGCDPLTVNFTNKTDTTNNTFKWEFSDGSSSQSINASHVFTNLDTLLSTQYAYHIVRSKFGCFDTTTTTVKIDPRIVADFDLTEGRLCNPYKAKPIYKSYPAGAIARFYWDYGNGSGIDSVTVNPLITYSNPGSTTLSDTIKLTVRNSKWCTKSVARPIKLYPTVKVNIKAVGDTIGCNPLKVDTFKSTITNLAGTSFNWQFGDNSTSNSATPANHTFTNYSATQYAYYTVRLQAFSTDLCQASDTIPIKVYKYVKADFSIDTAALCSGGNFHFHNTSSFGVTNFWDYLGNMTFVNNPSASFYHSYTNIGPSDNVVYNVKLRVKNNDACYDSVIRVITIHRKVNAGFFVNVDNGCNPLPVTFTNNAPATYPSSTTFNWTFGDGSSTTTSNSTPFSHNYQNYSPNDTAYKAQLTAISPYACQDTTSHWIQTFAYIDANFSLNKSSTCSDKPITVSIAAPYGIKHNKWDFGDGTWVVLDTGNVNLNHTFTNSSPNSSVIRTITHTVWNNHVACNTTTFTRPVTVYPRIVPAFTYTPNAGCNPLPVQFTNATNAAATIFSWNFDDGNMSSVSSPSHTFNNLLPTDKTYNVKLIASSPQQCIDSITQQVTAYSFLHADIKADPAQICSGNRIYYKNNSKEKTGITDSYWDFDGNGINDADDITNIDTSHFYTNTTTGLQNFNVRLVIKNNHNCTDTTLLLVTIYPKVTAGFTVNVDNGCNPLPVTFTNNALNTYPSSTIFNWNFGDGSTSALANPSNTYQNNSSNDVSYKALLTAVSPNGCRDTISHWIQTFAFIDSSFTINKSSICSGSSITASIPTPYYGIMHNKWDFGDGKGQINDIGNINQTHQYTNTHPTNDSTYTISHWVWNDHISCIKLKTANLIVHPKITANFNISKTADCNPLTTTFTDMTNAAAKTFEWDLGGDGSSGDSIVTHTFNNTSSVDRNYRINLKATSAYGCQDTISKPVTAYAFINANFSIAKGNICDSVPVVISDNTPDGVVKRYWDYGDTQSDSLNNRNVLPHLYRNKGTASIMDNLQLKVRNSHYCYATSIIPIIVYPQVRASFTQSNISICDSGAIQFTGKTDPTASPVNDWNWTFDDGTGVNMQSPSHAFFHLNPTVTTFWVKLHTLSVNLCEDRDSVLITTQAYINSNFTVDKRDICHGESVQITNNSKNGEIQWIWNYGDGSPDDSRTTSTNPVHNYYNWSSNDFVLDLRLVVSNGAPTCYDTLIKKITVHPKVRTSITADVAKGCNPLTVSFTGTDSSSTHVVSYWDWDFNDGNSSKSQSPVNQFTNLKPVNNDFLVKLHAVSAFQCDEWDSYNITVYPYIQADFKVPNAQQCSGSFFEIQDTSRGGVNKRYWTFGEGQTSQTGPPNPVLKFSHQYFNKNHIIFNPTVKLVVDNNMGCRDSISRVISVYPKVTADFDFSNGNAGCSLFSSFLVNNSVNASDYNWNFGDKGTSKDISPKHDFINYTIRDTVFTITLDAVSDYLCSDSIKKTITIYHKPMSTFYVDTSSYCSPFTVTGFNTSKSSTALYTWSFGDNSSVTKLSVKDTVKHLYKPNTTSDKISYIINLHAETPTPASCKDDYSLTVAIFPKVFPAFDSIIPGCNPYNILLTNKSRNADFYFWDFGDGLPTSKQATPSHIFNNNTEANVSYKVWLKGVSRYTCFDSVSRNILVYPAPNVDFTASPNMQKFPDATIKLVNKTNPGPWKFKWIFHDNRDTLTDRNLSSYTFLHWGKYLVELTALNPIGSCVDTATANITIQPPQPKADFDSSYSGCAPLTVFFINKSWPVDTMEKLQNTWSFDEGTGSTLKHPVHTFVNAGDYNVKLTVQGEGGTDTHYEVITIFPKPEVNFNVEPKLVMLPDDVIRCFNNTRYGFTYKWDFGDGTYSSEKDPTYKYKKLGDYNIKLIAWSENKCVDSLSIDQFVTVTAPGKIIFPNAFTPNLQGPSDGRYNAEDLSNRIFFPYQEGVSDYRVDIFNRWGELIYTSKDVSIGWDGYYKGKLCKQDVYVYKATGKFYNGKTFSSSGDITLLYKKD